ncbi:MAG: PDZ domain-containing protein [Acidobacteria bacterium]|jgi:general secretion pathway protein C|nr:MAG: PDZ domain-containing protein [Acidobacteriota bacterium]
MYLIPLTLLVPLASLLLFYGLMFRGLLAGPPTLKSESLDPSSLFARFEILYPKKEKKKEDLPPIRLLATSSGFPSLALADVGGTPRVLRIGSVVGSYRIANIERNYIVLEREGRKMAIGFNFGLKEPQAHGQPSTPTPQRPSPTKNLQASLPRGELERVTADPGIMFRQMRLVPFVQEGRTKGFLFEWIEPGSIFERSGIKPGDVLLSINNQEIRSGEDAFRILQVLRNESSIKLNLQRGQDIIELSLRVE